MKDQFRNGDLKSHSEHELKSGQQELLEDLKTYSKSDLYKADPNLLARLTPHQRAELFFNRSNQSPETPRISKGSDDRPYKQISSFRKCWNKFPLTIRSLSIGLFFTASIGVLSIAILDHQYWFYELITQPKSLSSNSITWPTCPRLTSYADGCLYTVSHRLSWASAIDTLNIDGNALIAMTNRIFPSHPLERGQPIARLASPTKLGGLSHVQHTRTTRT